MRWSQQLLRDLAKNIPWFPRRVCGFVPIYLGKWGIGYTSNKLRKSYSFFRFFLCPLWMTMFKRLDVMLRWNTSPLDNWIVKTNWILRCILYENKMSIPIGSLEKPHWWNGMHEVSESSEYVQSQKCKWINKNHFFPLFYYENIAWHFYLWKNFTLNFCSTLRMWSYFYKTDFHIFSSSYEICFIFGFLKYNRKSMSLPYHWMKIHLVAINQKK